MNLGDLIEYRMKPLEHDFAISFTGKARVSGWRQGFLISCKKKKFAGNWISSFEVLSRGRKVILTSAMFEIREVK
tara:strand:- start:6920 stop:7144 length:225 start_codon:yes stop_codon:yes gene_type:complete